MPEACCFLHSSFILVMCVSVQVYVFARLRIPSEYWGNVNLKCKICDG